VNGKWKFKQNTILVKALYYILESVVFSLKKKYFAVEIEFLRRSQKIVKE
jgi:hypothetical protein